MKFKITLRVPERKLIKITECEYKLKDFIKEMGSMGYKKFKVEVEK